ncbi:SulP family inorganic anion transporter [Anaerophilus nitritogenes]|uniref:SulP family inorganic anion transporter n=1 Tax=Anaerophilus nitritogenes TaxID=2498136 RepID=UPI00242EFA2E|nr:SulP family inorganic anion transporter [Anaerophilus nitritogenes]
MKYKKEWFHNIKGDLLSSIVVAIALIPEAIGFSIVAGVDPMVGLYASFCIATIIAFTGSTPGMISAATGAMALLVVSLVKDYGVEYLFLATLFTGIIQIIAGFFKFGNLMKFIPRPVMIGFVNALAILIFDSQISHFKGASLNMYLMVGAGLLIIYLFPKFSKKIPAPLVAIIAITIFSIYTHASVRTVGSMGSLPTTLPKFSIPKVPFNLKTLKVILPYSVSLCIVGLLESLLTSSLVNDLTDTTTNKNIECIGQGLSNIVTGFLGGMAGCAMLGQSLININSGGRGRLSSLSAGVFLMFLILVLKSFVLQIPIAALVSVMIVVSIGTFDWHSLKNLYKMPKSDAFVMIVTVVTVVFTHNLAIGVFIGVILSGLFFASKISKLHIISFYSEKEDKKVYTVTGQIFFASTIDFIEAFDFKEKISEIDIDFTHARLWDDSAVGAIDKILMKFNQNNIKVNIIGLNKNCSTLFDKLSTYTTRNTLTQTNNN